MTCTSCGRRQARRRCPALRQDICSVCCGTKRQVEIACPADCRYLAAAQAHPPSVVRRRREEDFRAFLPTVRDLTEQQEQLLWSVLGFLRAYRGDGLIRTSDLDVQDMAEALAGTFETAAKGLIYEQRPASIAAQRLGTEMRGFLSRLAEDSPLRDGDLAAVFKAVALGAREARKTLPGGDTAYVELIRRVIVPSGEHRATMTNERVVPGADSLLIRP